MLQPWHDFFVLLGTASATLVGLMFVAASVGTGVFTEERQVGLRTFLSPTVVAFSVVLATSLIAIAPVSDRRILAALLAGLGVFGTAYSWRVWRRMVHGVASAIDHEDRVWYFVAPPLAYVLLAAAGAAFALVPDDAAVLLAGGAGLLLLAGVRNAWDMTTWVVLRRRD